MAAVLDTHRKHGVQYGAMAGVLKSMVGDLPGTKLGSLASLEKFLGSSEQGSKPNINDSALSFRVFKDADGYMLML